MLTFAADIKFLFLPMLEDVFSTSEMAATIAEITKIDPNFNKDKFLMECEREIIPTVLEVFATFYDLRSFNAD